MKEQTEKGIEAARWVTRLLQAHGVRVVTWDDGTQGLLNVPSKWASIIGDLAGAIQTQAEGDPLPEVLPAKGKGGRK
jgi:hypothetical protein